MTPRQASRPPAFAFAFALVALAVWLPASAQQSLQPGGPGGPGPSIGPGVPAARPQPPEPPDAPDPASSDSHPQQVEITGVAPDDTAQRRVSTAAKIIIGRDEIDRYGDSSVGEIMKRLPGISVQGPPGRGGAVRMRGLGNGYTQILIDGERVPPGFSLDSLAPEQIERIEILRAPTAETGARAIAGTINIITRDGYRKRLNEIRLTAGLESGSLQPAAAWTHNDSRGDLVYSTSLSLFHSNRESDSLNRTTDVDDASGATTLAQQELFHGRDQRSGLHATARLQWKLSQGESLVIAPMLVVSRNAAQRESDLEQSIGLLPAPYASSATDSHGRFTMVRINGQWNKVLGNGARFEWRAGGNLSTGGTRTDREEDDGLGVALSHIDDTVHSRDSGASTAIKYALLLDGEHSLVGGLEGETSRHVESHDTQQNGAPLLMSYGDNLVASVVRVAGYAQDEWNPSKLLALNAGLRWEAITTEGEEEYGHSVVNRSAVWTPMLHMVWKPEPKSHDQVRLSLTRSYRSPTLQNLVARPTLDTRWPVPGPNTATQPDRAGNPELKPELASGIDLAFEHYLSTSGLLSANLFLRRIHQLIRNLTSLEDVSWSPGAQRFVSRPQNVGDAQTEGLELEAKFRLSDAWAAAPKIDLRANASVYRSHVQGVAAPDNRIDGQPGFTANLGGDYKWPGTPFTVGGNANYTPGYVTQQSSPDPVFDPAGIDQQALQGAKRVLDAYILWVLQPGAQLRVTGSNLGPREYFTGSVIDANGTRETSQNVLRTTVVWQVRLELKI